MKSISNIILILFCISFWSCSDNVTFIDDGVAYSTYKVGQESIYKVEQISYVPNQAEPSTKVFFEKHIVTTVEKENNFSSEVSVLVYTADDLLSKWTEVELYKIISRPEELVEIRNNIPKVVLQFPVRQGISWDENRFNSEGRVVVDYIDVNTPFSIGDSLWDNTIKVIEIKEKSTLIDYLNKFKVYTPSVGLVYSEDISLEFCQEANCIGDYKIVSGHKLIKLRVK